ncbi:MAG TPA: YbhB/YbcL family Raf kinase inhibitor-like protein [Verrucomicrobiae bacterium]|nr:YbhB/YbcL family Raf kinase inhibitor-like protein [Verrucomicrobiae bacterium]
MTLTSTAFSDGGNIPNEFHACRKKIPPLKIESVPKAARSLALIVEDPDAPGGAFTHWLLFNVDPNTQSLGTVPPGAQQGLNSLGQPEYGGTKASPGEHRYFFKAYALDAALPVATGVNRDQLEACMKNHILDEATLVGRYEQRIR